MIAAFRAELRRLISLRSTGVYAVMLLGCFFRTDHHHGSSL